MACLAPIIVEDAEEVQSPMVLSTDFREGEQDSERKRENERRRSLVRKVRSK